MQKMDLDVKKKMSKFICSKIVDYEIVQVVENLMMEQLSMIWIILTNLFTIQYVLY
jgi:hypothetical protein